VTETTTATATATATGPTAGRIWRTWRAPLLVGAVVVLGALVVAALSSGGRVGYLDPDSVSSTGSRALAQVLRGQGVEVVRAVGVADATQAHRGDTLVLSQPDLLTTEQLHELASTGADLVVVGAQDEQVVQTLAPDLSAVPGGPSTAHDPDCDLGPAARAGRADTGLTAYPLAPGATDTIACYPVGGDPTVVETHVDGQRIVFMGSSAPLENHRFAKEGNAALALGLLGANPRVVWQVPSVDDLADVPQATFWQLVPGWFKALLLQVALAALLLALWRARRLGPVVAERLPVVVRAAEATEGRGRMYRRAGARDRAAFRLRLATRNQILPLVGLSRRAEPTAVVGIVSARTGAPGPDVHALLYGGPPPDDAALVRLADDLDTLERQVRHP
jgi:Domain of unknown function (DUF4350)